MYAAGAGVGVRVNLRAGEERRAAVGDDGEREGGERLRIDRRVSRLAAIAAGGAAARPLLKWKATLQWRLEANQASTSLDWLAGSSSEMGSQAEV